MSEIFGLMTESSMRRRFECSGISVLKILVRSGYLLNFGSGSLFGFLIRQHRLRDVVSSVIVLWAYLHLTLPLQKRGRGPFVDTQTDKCFPERERETSRNGVCSFFNHSHLLH